MTRRNGFTHKLSSQFTKYFLVKSFQIGGLSCLLLGLSVMVIPVAIALESEEPEEEITVTGKILNRPVTSTQRRDATLQDSTRPAYTINRQEIEQQGARTAKEALKFLPSILGGGTVGTEFTANTDQTRHKRTYRKGSKQIPQ